MTIDSTPGAHKSRSATNREVQLLCYMQLHVLSLKTSMFIQQQKIAFSHVVSLHCCVSLLVLFWCPWESILQSGAHPQNHQNLPAPYFAANPYLPNVGNRIANNLQLLPGMCDIINYHWVYHIYVNG